MNRATEILFSTLLVTFCLCLPGCADDAWHAETSDATGYVTVNGEVPVGAIVKLHPVGEAVDKRASRPSGLVQEDGSYTLTTYEYGDGAPVGEYIFTLYWPEKPELGGLSPDRLSHAYATPKNSTIKVSVKKAGEPLEPVYIEEAEIAEPADKTDEGEKNKTAPPGPFPQ